MTWLYILIAIFGLVGFVLFLVREILFWPFETNEGDEQ